MKEMLDCCLPYPDSSTWSCSMVLSAGVNVHFDPQSINKLGKSFFIENVKLIKLSV
jgi:hypothetical protein